jgi:hypothetical protein
MLTLRSRSLRSRPRRYATQRSVRLDSCVGSFLPFSDSSDSILLPPYGTTLSQLSAAATCLFPDHLVTPHPVSPSMSLASFRELLLSTPLPLLNFHRSGLSQAGGGHWSPLAGYHEPTDSFLLLDVAKYKYPPAFVPTQLLYDAAMTVDACGEWDFPAGQARLDGGETEEEWREKLGCGDAYRGVVTVQAM